MTTIRRFSFEQKDLMKFSNEIRRKVFIEEQKVDPAIEYEHEKEGHYYLLFLAGKPIATARWRFTEKGTKLERFAMLKDFRNRGLGSILLTAVLNDVLPFGQEVYLHSQVLAINYYKRAGFDEQGDHFREADIEHVLMKYKGKSK
jgi:predicted GNAT family N-acyltransferase